jgi:catechol 2,3-dioxygenase-like lactoylglutathione lyase family enzyme
MIPQIARRLFFLLTLLLAWASPLRAEAIPPVTEAVAASARGDAQWLRDWIAKGGNPDQADAQGWTPLLMASARGKAAAVDALLNNPTHPADPGLPFAPSGALPIHMAGQSGDVETAKGLLAARPADINAVWLLNGHTLLLQAAFYGHVPLAQFAIAQGANPAATTLRGLTASDFAKQFDNRALLDALADSAPAQDVKAAYYKALLEKIQEPVPPDRLDAQQRSDAAAAAISDALKKAGDSPDPVDALMDSVAAKLDGVDVNRLAGDLRQPLLVVTVTGNNAGAHPESAASLRLQIAQALLERGASPLAKENHPMGAHAIIRASVFGHLDILKLMAAHLTAAELAGALNEIPAVNGLTALHDAVLRAGTAPAERLPRYLDQIRWEVASGARSDIEDFSGRTQHQYAEEIAAPERREAVLAVLDSTLPTPQWNHPAIAVPLLEPAVQWYSDVFGFAPLTPPITHSPAMGERWKIATSIFGDDITQVRFLRLRAPTAPFKQVIELFEIQPPPPPPDPETKRRSGYIHACLIVGDPATTAARLAARGGKILSRATLKEVTIIFCQDPYGNIIELASAPW